MAKTSEQLYQEINALNASDGDNRTEEVVLRSSALAAARLAIDMETLQDILGPTSTVDSNLLYADIEAIPSSDHDPRMKAIIFQQLGLAISRIGMAVAGINDKLGEGWNTAIKEVSLPLVLSITKDIKSNIVGAATTIVASISKRRFVPTKSTSITPAASYSRKMVYTRSFNASISATSSVVAV